MKVMKSSYSILQSIDKAITMVQYFKWKLTNQGETKGGVLKIETGKKKIEKIKKEFYLFKPKKIF